MTDEEAYGAVAGEMYIPGEDGYVPPSEVLEDLEPKVVEAAHRYAELEHLAWPPIASGYIAMVGLPPRDYDEAIDGPCDVTDPGTDLGDNPNVFVGGVYQLPADDPWLGMPVEPIEETK